MKKAESLKFLQLFVAEHSGDSWFEASAIAEVSAHVDIVEGFGNGFFEEPVLLENLYDVFNPVELLTGQNRVPGFEEFEKKLSNLVQRVRVHFLPRVH